MAVPNITKPTPFKEIPGTILLTSQEKLSNHFYYMKFTYGQKQIGYRYLHFIVATKIIVLQLI